MQEQVFEKVSVVCVYSLEKRIVMPVKLQWRGKEYTIQKLGYYHRRREGKTVLHIFSVSTNAMFFKLSCNGDTLTWILEEVSDGLAN